MLAAEETLASGFGRTVAAGPKPTRRAALLVATSILAAMPAVGLAQPATAPAQDAPVPVQSQDSGTLSEIVVTAQRRSELLSRTPLTVTVITPDLLVKKAVTSDEDLQFAAPGLTVRANATSNQLTFSIRGQSLDNFSSSRPAVLTYFNEVQSVNNSPGPFYDLGSIQVLKGPQGTLFGRNVTGGAVLFTTAQPASDFGGNLMVRAGNYRSREYQGALNLPIVSDDVILRVAGDYQYHRGYAFNEYDGSHPGQTRRYGARASLLTRFAPNLSNTLVVDYSRSTGTNQPPPLYSVNAVGSTNNGVPLTSTGALFFGPTLANVVRVPNAFNIYLATHPKAFRGGLTGFAALQATRSPFDVNVDSPLGHFGKAFILSDVLTYQPSNLVTVKNIFGLGRSKAREYIDFDGSPFLLQSTAPGGLYTNSHYTSEELQVLGKDASGRLDYVVGVYYSHQRNRVFTNIFALEILPFSAARRATYRGDAVNESYAGYAQGTYRFGDLIGIDGLGVTAGIRYTSDKSSQQALPGSLFYNTSYGQNHESQTTKKPSYQFGIEDQVNPNLLLYAVTRHSFRSGGFNGTAPPIPVDAGSGGNLFRPESTTDYEIGAKFQGRVGGVPLRLAVDGFSQRVSNVQRTISVFLPSINSSSSLTLNVPRARVRGVEVDGQISPTSWLDLGGNVAYTDAMFTRNTANVFTTVARYGPYGDTPKWAGTAFAQLNLPTPEQVGALSVRTDFYAQSSFYFSNLADTSAPMTKLPAYRVFNFRVALDKIGGSGFSLAALLRNAFDRTYYVGGFASGNTTGANLAVPGAPRTFFIEGRVKF